MRRLVVAAAIIISLFIITACSDYDALCVTVEKQLIYSWAQSMDHSDAEIAFLGDSRVIGADWYSAYPEKKVINLGVSGDKIENLLLRTALFDNLQNLRCCFVAIGVNNCWTMDFDRAAFKARFSELLDVLNDKGITIYLNTVPGITRKNSSFIRIQEFFVTLNVLQVNAVIKELAEERNLVLIDFAAEIADRNAKLKSEYSFDGCHYNSAGNQLWFDMLRPYIEQY